MAYSYTSPGGLIKPARGDDFNTWDVAANLNFDLIADMVAGVTDLALTGDTTLAITDGADDSGRAHVLNITSSDQHDRVITVPAVSKTYVVRNASSYRVKIKPTAGTATDVLSGQSAHVLVTTTHCYRISTSGWGLHSTVATTSGSSVTVDLTGLGEHFKNILLKINGVGAGGDFRYLVRDDAGSGGTATTAYSGSATLIGAIEIPHYRVASGSVASRIAATGASPYQIAATRTDTGYNVTSGIGSVVLSLAYGSFTTGSVGVYLE